MISKKYDPATETLFYINQILLVLDDNIARKDIKKVINIVEWEMSVDEVEDSKTNVFPVVIPGEDKT